MQVLVNLNVTARVDIAACTVKYVSTQGRTFAIFLARGQTKSFFLQCMMLVLRFRAAMVVSAYLTTAYPQLVFVHRDFMARVVNTVSDVCL